MHRHLGVSLSQSVLPFPFFPSSLLSSSQCQPELMDTQRNIGNLSVQGHDLFQGHGSSYNILQHCPSGVDGIAPAGRRAHKRVQDCSLLLDGSSSVLLGHPQTAHIFHYRVYSLQVFKDSWDLLKALKCWQTFISFRALD